MAGFSQTPKEAAMTCMNDRPHRFQSLQQALLTGVMLALAGCQTVPTTISQEVSINAGNPGLARTVVSDYLPEFKAGQTWVYGSRSGSKSEEVRYEVITVSSREVLQRVSVSGPDG